MTSAEPPSPHRFEVWGRAGQGSRASFLDGIVYREAGPWSTTILSLLDHLKEAGFQAAPRVVGSGLSPDGYEMVTYVPGDTPREPFVWTNEAMFALGELLRDLHRMTTSFVPPRDAVWRPWYGREMAMSDPVIGHCDAGPYNVVARDGFPVALVDWELAGPVDRLCDLALCGWLNAQLHEAAFSNAGDLPDVDVRAHQLRSLLDGYALASRQRSGLIGVMIEMIIRSAHDRASRFSVTPQTIMAVSPEGFPFGWDIAWRVGAARWIMAHRQPLEAVIL